MKNITLAHHFYNWHISDIKNGIHCSHTCSINLKTVVFSVFWTSILAQSPSRVLILAVTF